MSDQTISGYGDAPGVFRIGDVLGRAFSTWIRKLPQLLLIYIACSLPSAIISVLAGPGSTPGHANPNYGAANSLSGILNFVLLSLAQGATIVVAVQTMRGRSVRLGDAFSQATNRLLPIMGASFCFGVAFLFGTLLLVIPGLMLAMRYNVFAATCVVEERGAIDSLRRSAELTRGYRWPIFGLQLILWVPILILSAGIAALDIRIFGTLVGQIALELWSAIIGSLYSTMLAAIYYDLRLANEGGDTDQIAAVFD